MLGQRQRAIDFIASKNYTKERTHNQVRQELLEATGITYTPSNIKILRQELASGRVKSTEQPKTETKPPLSESLKRPTAENNDTITGKVLNDIKAVYAFATTVGGLDRLIELVTEMKATGIFK
jgi:hypothetical protein